MIPIDIGKFQFLQRVVDLHRCEDESVRFVQYTKPAQPDELLTMQRRPSYYDESTEYSMSVHLPRPRELATLVTVAHTSVNCWKVTVSTLACSDIFTMGTLREVTEVLKRVFV